MTKTSRKLVIVNTEKMMEDKLFRSMSVFNTAQKSKVEDKLSEMHDWFEKRAEFESKQTRNIGGVPVTCQSADIKYLDTLSQSRSFALLALALKLDIQSYFFPQSKAGGKSDEETSNLKAYKKALEIADVIWSGSSTLENVVKVNTVCCYLVTKAGAEVINRRMVEDFFSSREFASIQSGSADFLAAMEECDALKAKHMSGGKQTQTSQMIRTLVALRSGKDIKQGRNKDFALNTDGLVINALMRRLGQVTEAA